MANTSGIVVATSIPPCLVRIQNGRDFGPAYQRHCIESWVEAGFRVLSLNFPDEIQELAPQYPKVQFVAVANNRSENPLFRRKTPTIDELLRVLADRDEDIVGIINADILLESKDWIGVIRRAVHDAIAVGYRLDVTSLGDNDPQQYRYGYDFFFFERRATPRATDRPFAMGRPWWDYWLPIEFKLQGLKVNLITSPVAFHLQHPAKWEWPIWRYMAKEFAEAVLESAVARPALVTAELFPVIRLCRKVAAGPDVFEDVPPALLAGIWDKLPDGTRSLPGLSMIGSMGRGRDANRHRLTNACVAAISPSSLTTRAKDSAGKAESSTSSS